jgi:hypothetical protein
MAKAEEILIVAKGQDDASPVMDKAAKSIKNFDKSMKDTQRGFRLMRGGAAQLSMQVQDVAVQLQGGTNVMTVFAQQGSQIASLFGAGGAFIGALLAVGAAVGQTLLPRLFDTVDAAEEIDKAYRSLSNTLNTDFKGSLTGVSEELKRASEIGENYAKVILAQNMATAIQKVQSNLDAFAKDMADREEDFFGGKPGQRFYYLEEHAKALGLTRQEFLGYKIAVRAAAGGDRDAIKAFGDLSAELVIQAQANGEAGQKFLEMNRAHLAFIQTADQATQQVDMANNALKDLDGTLQSVDSDFNKARSEAESFVQSMDKQTAQLGMTKAQTIAYQASLLDLNDAEHALVATAIERALANEKAIQQKKDDEQATRDQAAADRELAALQRQIADGDLAALEIGAAAIAQREAKAKAAEKEAAAMRKLFEGLGLATGEEKLAAERDQRLERIAELAASETQIEINELELRRRAHEQYEEDLKELRRNSSKFEERDAVGRTNMVLGELGNMFQGVQANNKKMFAVQKAYSIVQTMISTFEGAQKAATAYAHIPPLAAAMAAAHVTAGLARVAQIRSQSFEGGGFTGMGSRSGGVDGKGGFPAILHPNETVIDHTKGQGQGITIINNVDARGSGPEVDIKIQQAMQVTSQRTIETVQDLMRRRRFV